MDCDRMDITLDEVKDMQKDHQRWNSAFGHWLKDVRYWRSACADVVREYPLIQKRIEQFLDELETHENEITLHRQMMESHDQEMDYQLKTWDSSLAASCDGLHRNEKSLYIEQASVHRDLKGFFENNFKLLNAMFTKIEGLGKEGSQA